MPKQFPKEQIIKLLKEQAKILGHAPKRSWWREQKLKPGKTTIQNRFGSWNKALKAAGLEPNVIHSVTRQMLLDDIKRVANELGKPPRITEYYKLGKFTNMQSHGGWRSLVKELDFPFYHELDRRSLIYFIREVAKDIGHTPTLVELRNHPSGISADSVYRLFDSFDDLVEAANLELPVRKGGWRNQTNDEFVKEVLEIKERLGHTPSALEFTNLSSTHSQTIIYRFGSYSQFLKFAGLAIPKSRWNRWSRDEIIITIQQFFNEFHRPPDQRNCIAVDYLPSNSVIIKEFGSFREAREAAGVPQLIKIPRRKQILCLDGHIAQSRGEEAVDNFLYKRNIPHRVQVFVCPERQWTCDFFIENTLWLEVDGFRGGRQGSMLEKFQEKINYYTLHNYNFLIIKPHNDGWQEAVLNTISDIM